MRADVAAFSAVKTFDPPLSALHGLDGHRRDPIRQVPRPRLDGLHLITHLSRARLAAVARQPAAAPPRPGQGPLAFRAAPRAGVRTDGPASGFDLTEAGTQKRLAVYLVRDPHDVPGIARLGPDALCADLATSSPTCSAASGHSSRAR